MKLAAALLLAVIVAASSTFAEALSIVNAEATFLPEETDSILLLTLGLLVIGAQLAWRRRGDSRALTSRR